MVTEWHGPWHRPAAQAIAVLAWLILCVWAGPAWAQAAPAQSQERAPVPLQIQVLSHAEFSLSAHGPWQPVALPDTWRLRGVAADQVGHYRLQFALPQVPLLAMALRIDRLSRVHEVRLNGQLVHGNLGLPETALRRPVPVLVVIPPVLLRPGDNRLEVTVDAGARAGLSPVMVGLQDELDEDFLANYHRSTTLPQYLNIAAVGIAGFMLLLWLGRRRDPALGSLAGMCLLASGRNVAYFNSAPIGSSVLTDALFFTLQAATVVLLGFFALHHAGLRGPVVQRVRAVLWAVAVVYPMMGFVASFVGQAQQMRGWLYPGLILLALGAVAIVVRVAWRRRKALDVLMAISLTAVLVAGAHDYLYQQGHTSVMDSFWLPFATPLVLLAYAGGLLGQLVQALQASEQNAAELERRVAERTHQLQLAHAARVRYLAAAGHDLRQPLVSIGLLSNVLGQEGLPAAARGTLARLQSAVEQMDDLFERLLDFSRLEAAAVEPKLQAVRMQALLDAVQAHVLPTAQAKGLRLRLRSTQAVVWADRTLLEQILLNLVGNALRYSASGTVLVAVRPHGVGWRLEVRDSGPGIAPQYHRSIFDEFVRLPHRMHAAAPQAPGPSDTGLGLGLAIAQRQAQLLGSRIELHSAPGCGSRFWLTLPSA